MKAALITAGLCASAAGMAGAQTLHLSSCEQELVLKYSTKSTPELLGISPGASVKLQFEPSGARLLCTAAVGRANTGSTPSSSVVISGARINRAIGAGARAEQNIGGQQSNTANAGKAASVVITIPSTWRLSARGWIGSLRADQGIWQVDVEIAAGEMSFAGLKDSRVIVDAGSITAQSLHGNFVAHVRGAGDIDVARSNDADLDLQLTGVGSMSFKGRAKTAVIRASGIGSIDIEKVAAEPKITASSLATIDIGR